MVNIIVKHYPIVSKSRNPQHLLRHSFYPNLNFTQTKKNSNQTKYAHNRFGGGAAIHSSDRKIH